MLQGCIGEQKRAIIYVRVSSEEQAVNYSLASQEDGCRRYAEQHGFTVVAVFQDTMTGTTLERPGLVKVRELIRLKAVDALIVYCSDRLTRSLAHSLLLRDELKMAKMRLHCVTKGPSQDTPEGNLFESIESAFAEYERLKLMERTQRGTIRRLESGLPHGTRLPFGYRYADEQRKSVVIDEEAAVVVRRIFRLYIEGEGGLHIVRRLTEERISTPADRYAYFSTPKKRLRGEWGPSTITTIIRNRAYKGELETHFGEFTFTVKVPPIVSESEWTQANQMRAERYKRITKVSRRVYILRGRVRCGECGGSCGGAQGGRGIHHYYRCARIKTSYTSYPPRCRLPQFPHELLDDAVWSWIDAEVLNEERIRATVEGLDDGVECERDRLQEERAALARQLANVEAQLGKLIELYTSGLFTLEQVAAQKMHLDQASTSCRNAVAELDVRIASLTTARDRADELCALVAAIRANLTNLTPEKKQRIGNLLDVEVVLSYEGEPGRHKHPARIADVTCHLTLDRTRLEIAGVSVQTTMPCAAA